MSFVDHALRALGFRPSLHEIHESAKEGRLSKGTFYRVTSEVDEEIADRIYNASPPSLGQTNVQDQLGSDLANLGFDLPLLVVQDPSDGRVWTLIARWSGANDSGPPSESPPFRFLRFDPIEPPVRASPLVDVPSLDVGLTQELVDLIAYELCHDNDPKRLAGLARCFDEDFPIAASLVRTKARLEDSLRAVNCETGALRVEEREDGAFSPLQAPPHDTLGALRNASRDIEGGAYLDAFAHVFEVLTWHAPKEAHEHGHDVLEKMELDLGSVPPDERALGLGKAVSCFSRAPDLARTDAIVDLSERLGLPRSVTAAAVAAVSDLGHGLAVVDPEIVRTLRPSGPKPASYGALKMAHAILRPEGSLAAAPAELGDVLKDLQASVDRGDAFAIKADDALQRARRLLDRQNWISWVERYRAAEGMA